MKSKTNVVSMSTGLNEATCVIKSQFVCAVKYKQAAVGMGRKRRGRKKKENRNQVCISEDLVEI